MCSRGVSVWIFDREQSDMNRTARKEHMSNVLITLAGMNDRLPLSCTNSHFLDRSVELVPQRHDHEPRDQQPRALRVRPGSPAPRPGRRRLLRRRTRRGRGPARGRRDGGGRRCPRWSIGPGAPPARCLRREWPGTVRNRHVRSSWRLTLVGLVFLDRFGAFDGPADVMASGPVLVLGAGGAARGRDGFGAAAGREAAARTVRNPRLPRAGVGRRARCGVPRAGAGPRSGAGRVGAGRGRVRCRLAAVCAGRRSGRWRRRDRPADGIRRGCPPHDRRPQRQVGGVTRWRARGKRLPRRRQKPWTSPVDQVRRRFHFPAQDPDTGQAKRSGPNHLGRQAAFTAGKGTCLNAGLCQLRWASPPKCGSWSRDEADEGGSCRRAAGA